MFQFVGPTQSVGPNYIPARTDTLSHTPSYSDTGCIPISPAAMGILEKIKEIEYEMTKTQKNKARPQNICTYKYTSLAFLQGVGQKSCGALMKHISFNPTPPTNCSDCKRWDWSIQSLKQPRYFVTFGGLMGYLLCWVSDIFCFKFINAMTFWTISLTC